MQYTLFLVDNSLPTERLLDMVAVLLLGLCAAVYVYKPSCDSLN